MRIGLAVVALLAAGCHAPKPVERPYAPPKAEDALAALRTRATHLSTVRDLSTRVEIQQGKDHGKMSVKMLIARGGRLRFEASAPVVGDIAALVSDGRRFAMNDLRNHQFVAGAARGCAIAQLIRISLEPEDVASLLLGGAPGLDGTATGIAWDPTHGGREVVTLEEPGGGRERLFLDGREGRWDLLGAERTDAAGAMVWRVEHQDWRDAVGGLRLPRRTHVTQPGTDVWIRWKEQEPNVEPPDGVFELEPPPGVPVTPVGC